MFSQYAKNYLLNLKKTIDELSLLKIEEIAHMINFAYNNEQNIFVMGNGGSASTASHFVCDFAKGCNTDSKKKFRVFGLNDNMPMMTAIANDIAYDDVFSFQLKNLLKKDDLVIVFTGSGNSNNILKAIEVSNALEAKTIALTGFNGGKVAKIANLSLVVPSDNMERIEDVHLMIEHILHLYFSEKTNGNLCF